MSKVQGALLPPPKAVFSPGGHDGRLSKKLVIFLTALLVAALFLSAK
jgi:hypothetical protein